MIFKKFFKRPKYKIDQNVTFMHNGGGYDGKADQIIINIWKSIKNEFAYDIKWGVYYDGEDMICHFVLESDINP